MADATKLLPCPFCGSPPYTDDETLRIFGKRTGHGYAVACRNCEATTGGDDDKSLAIAAWNTRAIPASQPASVTPADAMKVPEVQALVDVLAWYGEQARLCRLIHREGDAGRLALQSDGGGRAITALAALKEAPK